jgi:toxin ParE1/3/4
MRFLDAANATYKMILEAPGRWPVYGFADPRLKDIRKRAVLGFPNHLIFYRIDADVVEIVRVLHGARDIPTVLDELERS